MLGIPGVSIFLILLACLCAVAMTNQELIDAGKKTMDETDQAIERTKKVKNYLKRLILSFLAPLF